MIELLHSANFNFMQYYKLKIITVKFNFAIFVPLLF